MSYSITSTITLKNDVEMPRFGLGTFRIPAGKDTENAVRWALKAGYRAIDTAAAYGNETAIGKVVRSGIVPREDIFVTSKAQVDDLSYEDTKSAFDATMNRLGLETLDLYLIHWPANDWQGAWRAFEEIYDTGRVRAIGVSNFLQHHLEELFEFSTITPAVNQVELHPHLQQSELREYCHQHNIEVTAWSPLMKGKVLESPYLRKIGKPYGKNAIQVTLRWMLQVGLIIIPKSSQKEHIESNANIFDFELSDQDVESINALGRNERIGTHPDKFGT